MEDNNKKDHHNKTTDLWHLKAGQPYKWGDLIEIHEIGPYSILEFKPKNECGPNIKNKFHVYVNGINIFRVSNSLDGALIIAISYNNSSNVDDTNANIHYVLKTLNVKQ